MHKKPKPFKEVSYVENLKNGKSKSACVSSNTENNVRTLNEVAEAFKIEERRKRVSQYYCLGYAQWEIARQENTTQQTVQRDIEALRTNWRNRCAEDINELKLNELARIDHIERQMWEAYERSCKVKEVLTEEEFTGFEGGTTTKKKVVKEQLIGDTKYIDKIQWCIEQRCKILGITKDQAKVTNNIIAVPWDQIVGSVGADEINDEIRQLESLPAAEIVKEDETLPLSPEANDSE